MGKKDKQRYVSPDLQGKSQKVAETLTSTTEDLRRKYMETNEVSYEQAAEAVKEVKAFKGDMTDNAKKSYSKLKKGLNYLNTLSGKRVNLVVTEAHDSFNGSLLDDTIYIGADTFESDTWAETLVHEYTHFAEGTKEYQELMDALTGDSKLVEKTLSDIFEKAGYGFDKDKTIELLNRYERLQNSKNKTPNIDSNEEIRYNRKRTYKQIPRQEYAIISSRIMEDNSRYMASEEEPPRYGAARSANYFYVYENFAPGNFGVLKQIKITDGNREYIASIEAKIGENNGESIIQSTSELNRVLEILKNQARRNRRNNALDSERRADSDNGGVSLGESEGNRSGDSEEGTGNSGNIKYSFKANDKTDTSNADRQKITDTVDNEVLEELTEDELKYIRLYKSELGAHLSANMLGTESFIDKLVRENTTIAEKILNKLSDLKQMFERLGDAEARAEYKKLKKAEKLYLGAVEKAGYAYVGRKIVGAIDEREEASEPKYSFAGSKAKNADKMKLETAKGMLEGGVDSETVRKETGWFKGYDGKWRFEIDDFDSSLIENPNLQRHTDDGEVYFTGKISDIFDHKALFWAYPELKDINIVIQKTELGTDAIYQPNSNYITLSKEHFKRLTKSYYEYLNGGRKAEIERIEASEAYKNYNNLYNDDVMESVEPTEWLEAEKKAREEFYSSDLGKRYYELMWGKSGFVGEKFELGWSKEAKAVLLHELQHAIQNIEGFAKGTNTRDKNYDQNAGEIEARDVGKRADFTEEQRKNTRPDIDRTDAVIKHSSTESYVVKKDKNGREYWEIDSGKDIFKGLKTPEEYRDAAYSYLIANRDNKIVVKDNFGREITFIRLSAEEFTRSRESNTLFEDNPDMYTQKMRLIPSLEDILLHSNVNWNSPDHKNHKLFKEKGFENYRGRVRIDNVIFNTIVRVGKAKFGDIFYDINLEVDSYLPHTNNSASDINESTSMNSIPENSEKSNSFDKKTSKTSNEPQFSLKSNGKITKSRGEYQKLKANYTKEKKYDKKDVSKAVLDVPYISTLPKATQNDIIESMWYSLNTIEGDNQKDRFIELCYNRILRDLWQESKSFAELSTDEIREIEQKLYKTVRNIAKIGGSPSYLSKVEAQFAKTEAGRWRKKFLEAEEWNKIVGLLMSRAKKMSDIKRGAYLNATQYKQDLFKGSIEKLSRVEFRGNLNVTGTRKIVKQGKKWVFACSEDTHSLRLTSELVDLRSGYANPCAFAAQGATLAFSLPHTEQKKPPFWAVPYVAERKGFEPLKPY